jgi:hypothetical protein
MSDPFTAAWQEAEATAPPSVTMYATLELQHPAFVDVSNNPIPLRFVTGVADDTSFGIEAGATFNAGETVSFTAVPFFAEKPEFAEGKAPQCQVTVDNIGREIAPYLDKAISIKADLIVLFREYRSDDMSTPCYGPIEFKMQSVKVAGTTVIGTAQLDNLTNRKFPYQIYTAQAFPELLDSNL